MARKSRLGKLRNHYDPVLGGQLSSFVFIHSNKEGYMNHADYRRFFLLEQLAHAVKRRSARKNIIIDDSTDVHNPSMPERPSCSDFKRQELNSFEAKVPRNYTPLRPQDHPLINGTWKVAYQKARAKEMGLADFRDPPPSKATPEQCVRWVVQGMQAVTRRHIVGAWLASQLVTKEYLLANNVPREVVLGAEELLEPEQLKALKDEMAFFRCMEPLDAIRFAIIDGILTEAPRRSTQKLLDEGAPEWTKWTLADISSCLGEEMAVQAVLHQATTEADRPPLPGPNESNTKRRAALFGFEDTLAADGGYGVYETPEKKKAREEEVQWNMV